VPRALAVAALLLAAGCGRGGDPLPQPPGPRQEPVRAPAPDAKPPRTTRLTIGVSGDLLPHLPVVARAQTLAGGRGYDFAPMFRRIRPWVRRLDLALCHVETPLTPGTPAGYPVFRTPPALARAIRATGWDACSTASNHTVDRGQAGVAATLRALDRAGVRHTGSYRSRRARRRPLIIERRGVKIAFLAYTMTTNGIPRPHPWSVNLARPGQIASDARRARGAGASVVIVNLHWGTEYLHAPDAAQRRLALRLARSRAITAVVGQHAHVVQPIRRVRGRWVVFGAGNLLSNQTSPAATQDGMLVRLHVRVRRRAAVERVEYTPTWVRHPDYTVLRSGRTLRASWRRTVAVVGRGRRLRPVP
jgi:poly-gamma-glutamate capsule biosynthesis protein CapA/YwtB (metallophosphatase superfamily)